MKLNAFILLTTFMIFIAQTIQIPLHCEETQNKNHCAKCPMMAMHGKCMDKEQQKPKEENSNKSRCVDCPFFTVMMYQSPLSITHFPPAANVKHATPIDGNLSDYVQQLFKPPKASPVS